MSNKLESDRPQRNPATSYRDVAGEGGLVVIPGRSEVKVLNPVGTTVFGLLDGQHTIDEIVQQVVDEFEVQPDQAREDVLAFIDELDQHGMMAQSQGSQV